MQLRNGESSGWFYELLDTEKALGVAVQDARRCTTIEQVLFSLFVNISLAVFFGCLWVRYDLLSTSTVFLPVVEKAAEVIPDTGIWASIGFVMRLLLGITTSLLTSLVQAAYPRLATRYRGALWGLGFSVIFDLATDYRDVQADFPRWFQPLITAAGDADPSWWGIAGLVLLIAGLFPTKWRSLAWLAAAACLACLAADPRTVWTWVVIFIMTIFCSFVVQGLTVLHVGKCLQLIRQGRRLRAETDIA